jgi:LacI family transcriptional regulator
VDQADIILKNELDGVLVAPLFIEESIKFADSCKRLKVPYVFINSDIPNHEKVIYFGPNLFQSGYLAGHLMKHGISKEDKILIVNISKETDDKQHSLRIEEGFRAYFKDQHKNNEILKVHVKQTDYSLVAKNLSYIFENHSDIRAIFAPNSRVSSIACYVEEAGIKNLIIVGFDFIDNNIHFLKKGTIDFLICQKPEEQGYKAIKALYQMLILALPVKKINYMPNDIITKENHHFYHN